MTFEQWLTQKNAGGITNHENIEYQVDLAAVMMGNMSHNLARRNLYKWLEAAYIAGAASNKESN
jgi:hypothetical protein